jgi:hypothetical protein
MFRLLECYTKWLMGFNCIMSKVSVQVTRVIHGHFWAYTVSVLCPMHRITRHKPRNSTLALSCGNNLILIFMREFNSLIKE